MAGLLHHIVSLSFESLWTIQAYTTTVQSEANFLILVSQVYKKPIYPYRGLWQI